VCGLGRSYTSWTHTASSLASSTRHEQRARFLRREIHQLSIYIVHPIVDYRRTHSERIRSVIAPTHGDIQRLTVLLSAFGEQANIDALQDNPNIHLYFAVETVAHSNLLILFILTVQAVSTCLAS
jgi:hypothetical protein